MPDPFHSYPLYDIGLGVSCDYFFPCSLGTDGGVLVQQSLSYNLNWQLPLAMNIYVFLKSITVYNTSVYFVHTAILLNNCFFEAQVLWRNHVGLLYMYSAIFE